MLARFFEMAFANVRHYHFTRQQLRILRDQR